jgi:hypothetical protein
MKAAFPVLARLAVLASALAGAPALAATYYFSDCQAGAAPACVAGSNGNAGTSPDAPKQNLAGFKFAAGTGHAYRFARGGSFTDVYIDAPAGAVFEAYTPAWCGGDCAAAKPLLKARLKPSTGKGDDLFRFWFKRGTTVRDLELRGYGGGEGYGAMLHGSSDITLDNLTISGFVIGVHAAYGHNGTVSEGVTLRNSDILRNRTQGFLGAAKGLLLENNRFDRNGSDNGTRDHNIYLSSGTYTVPDVVVRGNTLTHNTGYAGAVCKAVSLVGHGNLPNLTIENNTIVEEAGAPVCWGIAINGVTGSKVVQAFPGLVIRGNTVELHDAGVGISCDSCPGAVIENNTIVRTGDSGSFTGVHIPSGTPSASRGDMPDDNVTVRNNTIQIDAPSRATGISVAPASSSDVVVSNLIVFGPNSTLAQCLLTRGRSIQSFEAIDNNLCWRAGGAAFAWSDQAKTLGAAQAAGFDQSSLAVDPGLPALKQAAGAALRSALSSGSPAINAGHRTLSSPRDTAGVQRDALPDIGAVERTARPAAPGNVVVQ